MTAILQDLAEIRQVRAVEVGVLDHEEHRNHPQRLLKFLLEFLLGVLLDLAHLLGVVLQFGLAPQFKLGNLMSPSPVQYPHH